MKSTGRLWLLAVCLLCGLVCTQAQEQEKKQLPREVPSPEKAARKMTDRMKEELQLTDKQYDKLYKLNLKEQQEQPAVTSTQTIAIRKWSNVPTGMTRIVTRMKLYGMMRPLHPMRTGGNRKSVPICARRTASVLQKN